MSSGYATAANRIGVLTSSQQQKRRIKRVKKMKLTWRQRLRNWFNKDLEDSDMPEISQDISPSDELGSEGMRFQLYRAAGGFIIETRHYDQKNDRNYNKLYIIRDDQDVGEEVGKIITMEGLR
jgi:hypothetical protein